MLNDPYFVDRNLYPNIDFYSGIIYRALGIPTNMFTVMFALGRLPRVDRPVAGDARDPGNQDHRSPADLHGSPARKFVPLGERTWRPSRPPLKTARASKARAVSLPGPGALAQAEWRTRTR